MKPTAEQKASVSPEQSELEKKLVSFIEEQKKELARGRFAEERDWYESALFKAGRQWLKWDDSTKRYKVIEKDPSKPKPMPVSNYFSRTIDANSSQLGGGPPKMIAVANDQDPKNRRAGEYAETAVKAIDQESGMRISNPLLAKHTVLFGVGVVKDFFDREHGPGAAQFPSVEVSSSLMMSCLDCGQTSEVGPYQEPEAAVFPEAPQRPEEQQYQCPHCGSSTTMAYKADTPVAGDVEEFSRGRISSEVRPIFEVYIPRDCGNGNLAKRILHVYRKPKSVAKRTWGDKVENLRAEAKADQAEIYLDALQALVNYNYLHEQRSEGLVIMEWWGDWDELPDEIQELLEKELSQSDPKKLAEYQRYGLFAIISGGQVLQYGCNNVKGKKPFTFYYWEVDAANPYGAGGLSRVLKPLQRRLNRLDALIELAWMANGAGKWIWPDTQTGTPPSGSPVDVIRYQVQGDGKVKPEFIVPTPVNAAAYHLRRDIINDFNTLGLQSPVNTGSLPQGGKIAFRSLAYIGAKNDELINTPRYLWEVAHKLRYEKVLILAQDNWTEERKVSVAGFNGNYSMQSLFGKDLEGDYSLEWVQDSSRPTSLAEKMEIFSMLLEAGFVDPADSATREYVMDITNLEGLNLADEYQYRKAERDLESIKAGVMPIDVPYQKWEISLRVFAQYTLTEEFEQLPEETRAAILSYTEYLNFRVSEVQMGMIADQLQMAGAAPMLMTGPGQVPGQAAGSAMQKRIGAGTSPLSKVPGQTTSSESVESAAQKQGQAMAAQLP